MTVLENSDLKFFTVFVCACLCVKILGNREINESAHPCTGLNR